MGSGDPRFSKLESRARCQRPTSSVVVKINVDVVDYSPADVAILEDGLTECFGLNRHFGSTLVGVQALALDGRLIEVEAVAVVE